MRKKQKLIALLIIAPSIIFATLCGGSLKASAMENTVSTTYSDDKGYKCPCPRGSMGLLKESVNQLKESGLLSDEDVKKIDSYMTKDRESKEAEIKEKIYNEECEKIDAMVSQKIITKEQGEKLKSTVKENIQNMKRNIKNK